jgi:NAD-dependent SIR2 family protein deacetylase
MIDYRFNTWRVSGETAPTWSETAYKLVRAGRGIYSGQQLAEVLYKHYVEDMTAQELNRAYPHMSYQHIKTTLSGRYNPEVKYLFMQMLEQEKDTLEMLFTTTTKGDK